MDPVKSPSARADVRTFVEHAAVVLHAGDASLTVVPELGMLVGGFVVAGQAVVSPHRPLVDLVTEGETLGIPLLHPWANRLGTDVFDVGATSIDLRGLEGVPRDPAGLAMHGLLLGYRPFAVRSLACVESGVRLSADFDLDEGSSLWRGFPFAHRVSVEHVLVAQTSAHGRLTTTVRIEPSGSEAVPVSFGWHPYLHLPGSARADWALELPAREHLDLDGGRLPTGKRKHEPAERIVLGSRTFDDAYALAGSPGSHTAFVLGDDRTRVTVEMGEGYRFAQLYAPADADVVAIEPMVAPTDALRHGDHPWVQPAHTWSATFSIDVVVNS